MHHNNYSAYTLDPEHGWIATHRLPLESAIRYSLEYKERTAGALVAVVPDGANPDPILERVQVQQVRRSIRGDRGPVTLPTPDSRDECYDATGKPYPYGRCDVCGCPCDEAGCTNLRLHTLAEAMGYGKAR